MAESYSRPVLGVNMFASHGTRSISVIKYSGCDWREQDQRWIPIRKGPNPPPSGG